MKERLKQIREYFNLTQEGLGNKLKIKRAHISALENGTRNITNRVISDICREFNVNETWLRTGEGEMFNPSQTEEIDRLAERYKLPHLAKKLIEMFVLLNEKEMDTVLKKIKEFSFQLIQEEESAATIKESNEYNPYQDDDILALIREKEIEKNMELSALQNTELLKNIKSKIS